jgi:hypothetical protein
MPPQEKLLPPFCVVSITAHVTIGEFTDSELLTLLPVATELVGPRPAYDGYLPL